MKKNIILILCVCVCLISCFNPKLKRIIKKEVIINDITFQWIESSSAYYEGADIILCKKKKIEDTICMATNITDIFIGQDTLIVGSYSPLMLYDSLISLTSSCGNINITSRTKIKNRHVIVPNLNSKPLGG